MLTCFTISRRKNVKWIGYCIQNPCSSELKALGLLSVEFWILFKHQNDFSTSHETSKHHLCESNHYNHPGPKRREDFCRIACSKSNKPCLLFENKSTIYEVNSAHFQAYGTHVSSRNACHFYLEEN